MRHRNLSNISCSNTELDNWTNLTVGGVFNIVPGTLQARHTVSLGRPGEGELHVIRGLAPRVADSHRPLAQAAVRSWTDHLGTGPQPVVSLKEEIGNGDWQLRPQQIYMLSKVQQ